MRDLMKTTPEKYKAYHLNNFKEIPQLKKALSKEEIKNIEVVGSVLPFKINNYLINELIDWWNIPDDPIFQLCFPQKGMLSDKHYGQMESLLARTSDKLLINKRRNNILSELNPHPAGQEENIPELNGEKLNGLQHKYRETVLFFPRSCQTCHAYCSFCFRWPQFTEMDEVRFAMKESRYLVKYLKKHPEVTDLLFTGGDPMIMSAKKFKSYIDPILETNIENLQTIRIGSKSLSFWPYKFISDPDADDMLRIFEKIVRKGYHLAFMAHFNHPNEMETKAAQKAIKRIQATGAQIRTQSPLLRNINNHGEIWKKMWKQQVQLGMIPYYMFVARNTGAHGYFAETLEQSLKIYRDAYQGVSGIARTVRGPSMSAYPGKVQIMGTNKIHGEKVFTLQFIQARNPNWVRRPFFAKFNPNALWLDDLQPAFDETRFFFEEESGQSLKII